MVSDRVGRCPVTEQDHSAWTDCSPVRRFWQRGVDGAWRPRDYVLALKPVANLKPDDWMGTAAP